VFAKGACVWRQSASVSFDRRSSCELTDSGKVYMRLLLAEKVTDNFCDLKFEFRLGFNCISALAGSVLLSIRLPGFCKFAKCQALMMDERWC